MNNLNNIKIANIPLEEMLDTLVYCIRFNKELPTFYFDSVLED